MFTFTFQGYYAAVAGNFVGALLILGVSFVDYELRYIAVAILIVNISVSNLSRVGYLVNMQDVAPRLVPTFT